MSCYLYVYDNLKIKCSKHLILNVNKNVVKETQLKGYPIFITGNLCSFSKEDTNKKIKACAKQYELQVIIVYPYIDMKKNHPS